MVECYDAFTSLQRVCYPKARLQMPPSMFSTSQMKMTGLCAHGATWAICRMLVFFLQHLVETSSLVDMGCFILFIQTSFSWLFLWAHCLQRVSNVGQLFSSLLLFWFSNSLLSHCSVFVITSRPHVLWLQVEAATPFRVGPWYLLLLRNIWNIIPAEDIRCSC